MEPFGLHPAAAIPKESNASDTEASYVRQHAGAGRTDASTGRAGCHSLGFVVGRAANGGARPKPTPADASIAFTDRWSTHMESFLRFPAVLAKTGLSRSTIYLKISRGEFPAPVKLGQRAVGWPETAIDRWIATRIDATPPTD
jgi:prophage regulatory protein